MLNTFLSLPPIRQILILLMVIGFGLFVWAMDRWSDRLLARDLKKLQDFFDTLSFVEVKGFSTTTKDNIVLKITLCVWQDKEGKQYASYFAQYPFGNRNVVLDGNSVSNSVTAAKELLRPYYQAVPVETWESLLPEHM